MADHPVKKAWLRLLKHTLNRVTVPLAHSGYGPISTVHHVGRKSGKAYETPLMLARAGADFVAELTYGPEVAWYRNVVAAGHCTVTYKGKTFSVVRVEPCDTASGLRAFGQPAASVLRLLGRKEFRYLRTGR